MAWLIIQIVETIFPVYGLSDGAIRLVVTLLAIGLLPVVILAWAFELTPEGLKKDRDVDRSQSISQKTGKKLDRMVMVILTLALGYFAFDKFVLDPQREVAVQQQTAEQLASATEQARTEGRTEALVESYGEKSIAVLPFVNMSDDASNEYFSDGISEELLNLLTRIPQMRVIARTSSFSFKGKDVPIAEIGQILNVAHVLEGSVRKSGNKVRITAQLIDAHSETHLWSETYDRTLDDIFVIQDEIAAIVVAKLKVTLLGPPPKITETDPAAYTLFLKARQLTRRFTPEALQQSLVVYKQVLEIDPEYTEALLDMAELYIQGTVTGILGLDNGFMLGREAAERALTINPDLAWAYATLSRTELIENRDLKASVRYFTRAVELEPHNPHIYGRGELLLVFDRLPDLVAILKLQLSNNPLNQWSHLFLGRAYMATEQFREALLSMRTARNLDPQMAFLSVSIGEVYLHEGKPEAALLEFNQEPIEYLRLSGQTMAHFALGQLVQSDSALAELIEKHEKTGAINIAEALAYRNEVDRAFMWLDKAIQYNDTGLTEINSYSFFENLHSDSRWLQIQQRIGVAPEQIDAIEWTFSLPQ